MTTAAVLALVAGVLAWPVPRLLAASRWPHRCPRAAIVLWQAVGLAGGMSALLAAVAFTVAPLSAQTPAAIADHAANIAAGAPLDGLGWTNLVGLAAVSALAARLFGVLGASTAHTLRERHRHRHLVDLAGRRHRRHDPSVATTPSCGLCEHRDRAGTHLLILEHPVAVAYCVPGVRQARVVVSRGLLTTLSPAELDAVLTHEEAHVSGRHDLVIQPFIAWERTFPFLRPARDATNAVSLLVEMLADDAAARRAGGRTLARALARLGVAQAPVPAGALGILGNTGTVGTVGTVGRTGTLSGTGVLGSPTTAAPSTPPAAPLPGSAPHRPARPLPAPPLSAPAAVLPALGGGRSDPSGPTRRSAAELGTVAVPACDGVRSPVVTRIARLLDPPAVPWWLPAGAYLAASAVLATPALALLLG